MQFRAARLPDDRVPSVLGFSVVSKGWSSVSNVSSSSAFVGFMASLSSLDMLGLFFLTKTPPPLPLLFSFSGGFFFIPPLFPTSKGEVSSSSSDPDSSSASDFFLCIALSFFGFLEVAFPSSSAPSILGSLGCLGFFLLGRRLGRASTSSSTCVLAAIV
jgi:hypothetical protein